MVTVKPRFSGQVRSKKHFRIIEISGIKYTLFTLVINTVPVYLKVIDLTYEK